MQRGKNLTIEEKHRLLDLIFSYRHIIENKETDGILKLEKEKAWINITQEFNKNKTVIRPQKALHLCWDNIKASAKKYCATLKREYYKTGGGISNVAKDNLLERAKEIVGVTVIHVLINPFDSDFIHDDKENTLVEDILQEDDDESNPSDVFSYLLDKREIDTWKSWDSNKLKSKLSPPLRNNTSVAGTSTGASTDSTINKKRKLDDNGKHVQTLSKAKTELTNILTTNVKEKINYEIDLLKATLEK